ncbi:hypothetical protein QLT39_09720, partial [Streptococcus equi subsp. zooepidemicus]|uniref:hypothetical protein n=1 Tax=Streptococcus equi TaxID=1336 RepID=UPI0024A93699
LKVKREILANAVLLGLRDLEVTKGKTVDLVKRDLKGTEERLALPGLKAKLDHRDHVEIRGKLEKKDLQVLLGVTEKMVRTDNPGLKVKREIL